MTLVSVAWAGGAPVADDPEALAHGTRVAFIIGGVIASLGAIVALFVREEQAESLSV